MFGLLDINGILGPWHKKYNMYAKVTETIWATIGSQLWQICSFSGNNPKQTAQDGREDFAQAGIWGPKFFESFSKTVYVYLVTTGSLPSRCHLVGREKRRKTGASPWRW